MHYDLAIAGAGPAGSTLALLTSRAGMRVLLLERTRFERPRIGETAPPELRHLLARLGLAHVLGDTRAVPAVVSVWGSSEPLERSHIYSPYGEAVHLDRRAFDESLAQSAQAQGADLRLGVRATFERCPSGGYEVAMQAGERVFARHVVLASGRTSIGAGLPYRKLMLDDQVAVAARFALPVAEPRTVIEAIPGGWFYLAALPANCVIAVFVTRIADVPADRASRLNWWCSALARTRVTRKAISGSPRPASVSVHDARASFASIGGGKDWLAIGDARFAPDPLSGHGIVWALDDAMNVAQALLTASFNSVAERLADRTAAELADYQAVRGRTYDLEKRFLGDRYWDSRARLPNGKSRPSQLQAV